MLENYENEEKRAFDKKRVLAMYDVRGKQEYIYRSRRIKEIVGASAIIRDVFADYLYPAAREVRNRIAQYGEEEAIYLYQIGNPEAFSVSAFEDRMTEGKYIGEVVYDGGGNFLVLYKDKETCIQVNRIFTKNLMEHTGILKVLCTILEDLDCSQYLKDRSLLYSLHRGNENRESVIYPVNSLPISQVDLLTSRPLVTKRRTEKKEGQPEKMSLERAAKLDKYQKNEQSHGINSGERILDNIVTEKGKESLLAVIYIDGNNMGAQVQDCLKEKVTYEGEKVIYEKEKVTYEECVTALRKFSAGIQKHYVDERIEAINNMLDEKYKDYPSKKRRTIVSAGDEMTIICNARDALEVVRAYFKGLPKEGSSCAGIAIFHSHAPYADAYRIAEECCESGKKWMKENKLSNACLLDFHYCQGGMGISLEGIRNRELRGEKPSRPWIMRSFSRDLPKEFYYSLELAEEMSRLLRKLGRSNVKGLLDKALNSLADLEMDLERINAHRPKEERLDFTLNRNLNEEQKRKLLYDIVLVYDLWFQGEAVQE